MIAFNIRRNLFFLKFGSRFSELICPKITGGCMIPINLMKMIFWYQCFFNSPLPNLTQISPFGKYILSRDKVGFNFYHNGTKYTFAPPRLRIANCTTTCKHVNICIATFEFVVGPCYNLAMEKVDELTKLCQSSLTKKFICYNSF